MTTNKALKRNSSGEAHVQRVGGRCKPIVIPGELASEPEGEAPAA
jgi:hypothetical protein